MNVTSVKGRIALPSDNVYISTKWALEALSDILRRELKRFGVKVVIVEPGNFGGITGMLNEQNASCFFNCGTCISTHFFHYCLGKK